MAVSSARKHEVMLIWYAAGSVDKAAEISKHSREAITRWRNDGKWEEWRQQVDAIAKRELAQSVGKQKGELVAMVWKLIQAAFDGLKDRAGADGSLSEVVSLIKCWLLLSGEADSRGEHVFASIDDAIAFVEGCTDEQSAGAARPVSGSGS